MIAPKAGSTAPQRWWWQPTSLRRGAYRVDAINRPPSHRRVDSVDQGPVACALPARDHVVHDVAQRDACHRIGKADGAARPEVTEASGVGTKGATRRGRLEAEAEGDLVVQDRAVTLRLRRRRLDEQIRRDESAGF